MHTRSFGTLTSPPPPVKPMPWGIHPPGHVLNRGFKHCGNTELYSVLVRGFREVGEIVVRIVDEHRVIVNRSDLVELFGFINLCLRLIWPGSQTSR